MAMQAFFNRNAKKDDKIAELEKQVKRLTEQSTKLAEEKATLQAENARLELTWKTHCDDLQKRYDRASQEAEERFKSIQSIRLTLAELLPFLRALKKGNFRSDRGNTGKYEELREYIVRYDKAVGE